MQQFGVHLNGYKRDNNDGILMWIARRSFKKPTFPGKLDQIVSTVIVNLCTDVFPLYHIRSGSRAYRRGSRGIRSYAPFRIEKGCCGS